MEENNKKKNNVSLSPLTLALLLIILFLIVVIMLIGAFALGKKSYLSKQTSTVPDNDNLVEDIVERLASVEIEKEKVISSSMIQEGIRDIGKLVTEEYSFTEVESFTSTKEIEGWPIPFTENSYVYSYDGVINAGIDFTRIEIDKDDEKKRITITLPHAEIISSEIDPNSFRVYNEKQSIFNPSSVTDYNTTLTDLLNNAETRAVEKGILKKAEKNSEDIIENFVRSTYGLTDYKIVVETTEEEAAPAEKKGADSKK